MAKKHKSIRHSQPIPVHEIDFKLAVTILMIIGIDIEPHTVQGLDDLFQQLEAIKSRTNIVGWFGHIIPRSNGTKPTIVSLFKKKELWLNTEIKGVAQICRLCQHLFEDIPAARLKGFSFTP